MEYLGKLHQAAVEFPQTDIWMDSCGEGRAGIWFKKRNRRRYQ